MKINRFNTTNLVGCNILKSMSYKNGLSPPIIKLLDNGLTYTYVKTSIYHSLTSLSIHLVDLSQ